MQSDERYTLELIEAVDPIWPSRPVAVRLRLLLKIALRGLGLKCTKATFGPRTNADNGKEKNHD